MEWEIEKPNAIFFEIEACNEEKKVWNVEDYYPDVECPRCHSRFEYASLDSAIIENKGFCYNCYVNDDGNVIDENGDELTNENESNDRIECSHCHRRFRLFGLDDSYINSRGQCFDCFHNDNISDYEWNFN
jgi:uncharacterized Zn-finger protein